MFSAFLVEYFYSLQIILVRIVKIFDKNFFPSILLPCFTILLLLLLFFIFHDGILFKFIVTLQFFAIAGLGEVYCIFRQLTRF